MRAAPSDDMTMPKPKLRLARTVRWRLTLMYSLVLLLTFALFGVIIDRLVSYDLYDLVDRQLRDTTEAVSKIIHNSNKEAGSPTIAYLQEEFGELALSTQVALRLDLPGRDPFYYNTRLLSDSQLTSVLKTKEWNGTPLTIQLNGHAYRLLKVDENSSVSYRLLLARNLSTITGQFSSLRETLVIVLPLILLAAGAGGYLLASRALSPIEEITQKARRIEAEALHERLEVPNPADEIGRLAGVLNDLFERLQGAFQQQRQLLGDAAHELRTPVAILRSQLDVTLQKPRSAEEYEADLSAIRIQTNNLSSLVDDLLFIARAEAKHLPVASDPVDLVESVDEVCRSLRPLIRSKNLNLHWQVGDEISICGDARLLQRAINNLVSNAIKFTPECGSITVMVEQKPGEASIAVSDTGVGVAAQDLPRIFDRFFRADRSSNTGMEGSGLGLAIVKMIAELHRGEVTAESKPGKGSTFTLRIPKRE